MRTAGQCQLCERQVGKLTLHHLVPKSQAGKRALLPTAEICSACHRQLHTLYSNKRLAGELSSIEDLKSHPAMRRFLNWVRKQDPNRGIKVRGPRAT